MTDQPTEGVALTKASEVMDLLRSRTDPMIKALNRAQMDDADRIELAYALIADRKDRSEALRTPASGAVEAAEIKRVIDALEIPYPRAAWEGDCRGSHIQARKDAKALIERLAALTSEPKAEGEIKGWFWRIRGVKGHFRSAGPVRPSFSSAQPGEVYDLQPIYPDAAPQPLQGGEVTMEELVHPVAMVIDSAPGDWSADDLARELLALIFAALISPARREGEGRA